MKAVKNIATLSLMLLTLVVFGKTVTTTFKVEAQCGMCKDKIETALDIKGISFAEYDVKTKMLTVRYSDKKVTEDKIHTIVSKLGYATSKMAADKDAQAKLDKCCKPKKSKKGCCSKH